MITQEIFDVLGKKIAVILNNGIFDDGWQEVEFSAIELNLSSGVYYYRMTAKGLSSDTDSKITKMYS